MHLPSPDAILDRVVLPTQIKNGNPLFQPPPQACLPSKSSSSAVVPIFTNCPMATSFLGHGLFRNSFPAHGARPEFSLSFNFASDFSERFSYPEQEKTGSLRYFGNRGSTAASEKHPRDRK